MYADIKVALIDQPTVEIERKFFGGSNNSKGF